jgi:MFS family permease
MSNSPQTPRKNLWLFGWISFLNEIASQMVYPLIPKFLLSLGATPATIGLIEGLAEATAALFKTVSGRLSDRLGWRKPFVFVGYLLAGLAKPFLYLAGGWGHVLGVRFADRLGKATRGPARDALLAASLPEGKRGRDFGIQRAMDRGGAIVGPLLALAILSFAPQNLRLVFLLAGIPAVLAIGLIPFIVERRKQQKQARPEPTERQRLLQHRPFRFFLAANILFTLGNASNAFLILKAQEIGMEDDISLVLLWTLYNVFCVISAPIFGGLSDRVGRKPVIAASFLYYAGLYLLFAFTQVSWAMWLLFAAYGLYYGLSSGVFKAYIAELVPADQRGTAYGLFQTGIGLALLPASLIMGVLWEALGSEVAFCVSAGLALAGWLLWKVGERR